jgi:NAD(P)-dependent dehydrogenase (short-subunit alcohol dehydrogenase family)
MKKVVLVTGASSGFGKAAAQRLLDTGQWIVYAGARRLDRMDDLAARGANVLPLDVTQDRDLHSAAARMIDEQGRIDALLANAGYGSYGMIESVPMDEIEYQYDVNVFGVARSIKAVLPQMRRQRSGRIVITESLLSDMTTAGLGWYASTKHALRAISTSLRQEVRRLGIDVVSIRPGGVATDFGDVAFDKLANVDHADDYRRLSADFHAYMRALYERSPGPDSTAAAMVAALTAKKPKRVYRTTLDSRVMPKIAALVPGSAYDAIVLTEMRKAGKKARHP